MMASKELELHKSLVVRAPNDPEIRGLVNLLSGEVIPLSGETDALAALLHDYREADSLIREAKKIVSREILNRLDKRAKWSTQEGQYEIKGDSPAEKYEYSGPALRAALEGLVKEGVIDEDAAFAALETKVTYKPKWAGIKALLKLGGRIEELILQCRYKIEDPERRVSVKLARPE